MDGGLVSAFPGQQLQERGAEVHRAGAGCSDLRLQWGRGSNKVGYSHRSKPKSGERVFPQTRPEISRKGVFRVGGIKADSVSWPSFYPGISVNHGDNQGLFLVGNLL